MQGFKPLQVVLRSIQNIECVKLLLSQGADPDAKDNQVKPWLP